MFSFLSFQIEQHFTFQMWLCIIFGSLGCKRTYPLFNKTWALHFIVDCRPWLADFVHQTRTFVFALCHLRQLFFFAVSSTILKNVASFDPVEPVHVFSWRNRREACYCDTLQRISRVRWRFILGRKCFEWENIIIHDNNCLFLVIITWPFCLNGSREWLPSCGSKGKWRP